MADSFSISKVVTLVPIEEYDDVMPPSSSGVFYRLLPMKGYVVTIPAAVEQQSCSAPFI